ncbi:MAG: ABC transporter ATP-binding protein [Lachnospiraceae bacterium]|nr:ABC transporter ATP-binding protein [Lachnospiraceae bacterium]
MEGGTGMSIELRHASFRYPDNYLANDDLNLVVEQGESVAIVGQNGAGKTTAVKMLNGLYRPTKGDVLVDGVNTREKTAAVIGRTVGYVFQNPDDQIFNQNVRAEIEYMPRRLKMPEPEMKRRVDRAVELTGLKKYMGKNPFDIPYPIRKFVTIADVLAMEPKYIIFDEPTAGQDKHGTELLENLLKVLKAEGVGVVTITHDMEFVARNFDRVVVMAKKRIIADDTAKAVFSNDEVMEQAKLKKPQICQVAEMAGLGKGILTIEELVELL